MARPTAGGFQVTGLRETVRDLEAAGVEVDDLKDAFQAIGNEVAQEAIGNLQAQHVIRTGAGIKTVKASRTKNKAVVRAGSSRAWYMALVDRNKQGHRGAGFLSRPANSDIPKRIATLERALDAIADKYSTGGTA